MRKISKNIIIENGRLVFRNFSGKEGRYNPEGIRNFCVFLEEETGKGLKKDGWNIRWLEPRNPDEEAQAYLQVKVNFGSIPPKVVAITSKNKTILDESTINMLDWAEIENVDLIIRPFNWEVSGKSGVKAYLKTMYVTLVEDEFEKKYRDVPDSAMNSEIEDDIPF